MKKENLVRLSGYFLYLIFFTSLFLSFRAISSFALGALLVWSLVAGKLYFTRSTSIFYLVACAVYFIIGFFSGFRFSGADHNGSHVLLQAGLLLTGLAVYLSMLSKKLDGDIIFLMLAACLGLILLYCLAVNLIEFSKTNDNGLLFYHALLAPAKQHAVYFSIYVFAVLIWLVESIKKNKLLFAKTVYSVSVIFFSLALFFLSSKLVLAFYMAYLLWQLIISLRTKKSLKLSVTLLILLVLGAAVVLFTRNPVGERFKELFKGDIAVVNQDKYDPGVYFNGLQFRLLQWRFVTEILNENRAWKTGVGPGRSQELLDEKYRKGDMYTGDPQKNDRGYLGYNTHNQFLEALLQNGINGSVVFLVISLLFLEMAWKKRRTGFSMVFILLFVYAFMESVFETQHGIILFSFLPLFLNSREETF